MRKLLGLLLIATPLVLRASNKINWIEYNGFASGEKNDSMIVHFEVDTGGRYLVTVSQSPEIGIYFLSPGVRGFSAGANKYVLPVDSVPNLESSTKLTFSLENWDGSPLNQYEQVINVEEPMPANSGTARAIAYKFLPVLKFDSHEKYFIHDLGIMMRCSNLLDENNNILCQEPITKDSLYKYASSQYKIDVTPNNYDSLESVLGNSFPITPYVYVKWSNGLIMVNYFFFYLYDGGLVQIKDTLSKTPKDKGTGWHEGDWEGLSIVLSRHAIPLFSAYSQHFSGEANLFKKTEHIGLHPVGYIAESKHATHLTTVSGWPQQSFDICDGQGKWLLPKSITAAYSDTEYWDSANVLSSLASIKPGTWGIYSGSYGYDHSIWESSPTGPSFKPRWLAPIQWVEGINSNLVCAVAGIDSTTDDDSAKGIINSPLNFYADNSATINLSGVLNYKWYFGDGDSTKLSYSPFASHTFASEGIYTTSLLVEDITSGQWDSDTIIVTISKNAVSENSLPLRLQRLAASPNPFIKSTIISYETPVKSNVSLKLYDLSGRVGKTLVDEEKPAGSYEVKLSSEGLTAGVYFAEIQTGNYKETKKITILK